VNVEPMSDALAPVRAALLAGARATAEAAIAAADAEACRTIGAARAEAEHLLAEARAKGEADAEVVRLAERARARRTARALTLAANNDAYETLRRCSREALLRQAQPELTAALTAHARQALGDSARVAPHPDGGVIGELAGVRVDCSVDALVDRAMSLHAGQLRGLWST
jgi:hypothetical protein